MNALTLWYDRPAVDWESEALPIGNGALGAMVFGGVETERLQINEKTLWTGGPGSKEGYDHGNGVAAAAVARVQQDLADAGTLTPEEVAARLGRARSGYGAYQSLGEVYLAGPSVTYEGYRRTLDLNEGVATVTYTVGEITYQREYFASYPARAIVVRIVASRPRSVSLEVSMDTGHPATVSVCGDRLTRRGRLADNRLAFETQIRLLAEGGTRRAGDNWIGVEGADAVTVVVSAGTDYAPHYPTYRGCDPAVQVSRSVDAVAALPYAHVRTEHVMDYIALFGRVRLDVGQQAPDMTTDQLLAGYTGGPSPHDRALEVLLFQYGRYLLIASSREGSLPANLQGVWNDSATPPWSADYHTNINLQMNYWPAEVTNLSETTAPLFDFIDDLRPPGRVTAQRMFGARGWVVHDETTPFGFTGVHDWPTAFWFPEAAAWLVQAMYEHYRFSADRAFLADRAYPAMIEAAHFLLDYLRPDPSDGLLVASPSYSPEHGDFSTGAAMAQQIAWDLFTNVLEAAQTLGIDEPEVRRAMERLDPGLRIGDWGQLQEWKQDRDLPGDTHRHVSHLFALHPGRQLALSDPRFLEAARVSLASRGDGGTGWSKAWKINFWARLLDGERAHRLLRELLNSSTLGNLLDTHPPFQVDGNLGATAGMAEMLLHSHADRLHLLPALPRVWRSGSFDGLRARGGFTVGATWNEGRIVEARLAVTADASVRVQSVWREGGLRITEEGGDQVAFARTGPCVAFDSVAGRRYVIATGP